MNTTKQTALIDQLSVIQYSITVRLPVHTKIIIIKSETLKQWEKRFQCLEGNTDDKLIKKEYKDCRKLLKCANKCKGTLEDVNYYDIAYQKMVEFTFGFATKEDFLHFSEKL